MKLNLYSTDELYQVDGILCRKWIGHCDGVEAIAYIPRVVNGIGQSFDGALAHLRHNDAQPYHIPPPADAVSPTEAEEPPFGESLPA